MKCSADGRSSVLSRFLRAAAAGLAAVMLAALAQPAAAQFKAPDIRVNEGEVAVFSLTLPRTYKFAVRFAYRTSDGTARKGRHYVAKKGRLVFPAGTRSAQVKVQTRVSPDRVTRNFKLVLSDKEMWTTGIIGGPQWSGAYAIIYVKGVPKTKTINAWINDTIGGLMGPE